MTGRHALSTHHTHRLSVRVSERALHVGRVGGLAAALGVGAVLYIGLGAGVASAEESSSTSRTDTASVQSSRSTSGAMKKRPAPKVAGSVSHAVSQFKSSASSDTTTAVGNEPVRKGVSSSRERHQSAGEDGAVALPDASVKQVKGGVRALGALPRDNRRDKTETTPAGASGASQASVELSVPVVNGSVETLTEPSVVQHALAPVKKSLESLAAEFPNAKEIESELLSFASPNLEQALRPSTPDSAPNPIDATGLAALMSLARHEANGNAEILTPLAAISTASRFSEIPSTPGEISELSSARVAVGDTEFTGRPSLITQVFTAVLRATKPLLSAAGISLSGSSASVPFFTDGVPPFFLLAGVTATSEDYAFDDGTTWKVWTLTPSDPAKRTEKVVIAVHGGSFVSQASIFHWWTYTDMVRDTGATVVVPLYPLANAEGTGGTAATVVPHTAELISDISTLHGGQNVSVLGDSAGGSIALAAMQLAVSQCKADPSCDPATDLPGRMVLFSPSLDSGLSNPNIGLIDDPLLDADDLRANGALWAAGLPGGTLNPYASPIYGSLEGLPPTTVYAGSIDLRAADVLLLQQKAAGTPGANFSFELRNGQIHDWLIFAFLPDAQAIRPSVYNALGLTNEAT